MDGHQDFLAEHARRQLARGDALGAIESLRQALTEDPDHPALHALLASALLASRRRHAARHEAELAVAAAPELAFAHETLGYVRMAFHDLRGAGECFARAVALAPDDADAHLALGRLHAAAGRRAEARTALERARLLDPGDPAVLVALGDLDLDERRVPAARARALEALQLLAEHEGALHLMGRALLAEGRADEAREHAIAILRQDATSEGAIRLLCAAKARRSLLTGLWWRWNAFMSTLGDGRSVLVLVGLYVAQRLATLALRDAGAMDAAVIVSYAWIAFAVYTWVGPGLFARSLAKELRAVRLRPDF
jgi:tetratricopeptide (TPR) repeat protein